MKEVSNQTLHEILIRVESTVKDNFNKNDTALKEVIRQTTATNGRVRKLEIWRGFMTGGLTLIALIIGYIIKML